MRKFYLGFILLLLTPLASTAEETILSWLLSVERKNEVAPINNELYAEECGACHFAYPPGLLPEASWKKVIAATALADHFGDNAELDNESRQSIEQFLIRHSADKSYYKRSLKIMAALKSDEAPMRITELRFYKNKHQELKDKHVKNNQKVKSFSYCDKCHRLAEQAIFDDDTVKIPEFGHWTW
ncbi:MAG: diheme cytochrome c [Gammaproteobacteria bacterium]|nr:diheme cytochrome c [Gammaproteobacteria bacterium]MDH5731278.1 diheme cytochrome c [Gammaproteobacteria bacterium]